MFVIMVQLEKFGGSHQHHGPHDAERPDSASDNTNRRNTALSWVQGIVTPQPYKLDKKALAAYSPVQAHYVVI